MDIPGKEPFELRHLVCDYNGTLAVDGRLIPEVGKLFGLLSESVEIHVVTADTFGIAAAELDAFPVELEILPPGGQDEAKLAFIRGLGAETCFCVGNGRNDALMLREAAIGVCLIQGEGASAATLAAADIVCLTVIDALELLLHPKRLTATLRV
jgi:soluble P-type ATPase